LSDIRSGHTLTRPIGMSDLIRGAADHDSLQSGYSLISKQDHLVPWYSQHASSVLGSRDHQQVRILIIEMLKITYNIVLKVNLRIDRYICYTA
ncbi:MAG: hypothetical protein WDA21_05560, partial [Bacilli bacterium]